VAGRLAALHPGGRLHIALAHGMAPFEPCHSLNTGDARRKLDEALRAAQEATKPDEPPLVAAYRQTHASRDHYPNTAELLRSAVGTVRLSGGITEVVAGKHAQLQAAWSGSQVAVVASSWRAAISPGGVLACPASLDAPWLLTMDPMSYREQGHEDDEYLYRADRERLSAALHGYAASGQPGAAALFVYAVRPDARQNFWAFAVDLAADTGTTVSSCWLTHRGGNRNLAAVLCSDLTLSAGWTPEGVSPGRGE
jgi:hypothetical protein